MKTLKSVITFALRNDLRLYVLPRESCPDCRRGRWVDGRAVRPEELFEFLHAEAERLPHFPCLSSTSTVQRCGAALELGAFQISLEGHLDWGTLLVEWSEVNDSEISTSRFDKWTVGEIRPQTLVSA